MNRLLSCVFLCALFFILATTGMCASFDERFWEKYAEIDVSTIKGSGNLAGIYLEPQQFGEITGKIPFADLRVLTDQKKEIPWQIISRRPETQQDELPVQMRNLSLTKNNETWLEVIVEKQGSPVNAIEVITPDNDFSRQVQVLGSPDGTTWNILRKDGIIFDIIRGEKLRRTRISFPQTNFRYLALKIVNDKAAPLTISMVKVIQEKNSTEQIYTIYGNIEKSEINSSRQENSHVFRMNSAFPIDRLVVYTAERNFHRTVEVQVKGGAGEWEHWAQGTIFSFDTGTIQESRLAIEIPEVSTREFRLVFKNFDSPPLTLTSVTGAGYRRLLVFKQESNQKLYLFWGNPLAQQPIYDLATVIAKQKLDAIPIAYLSQAHQNTKFAGNAARLPFTERYKYLLYVVVILAIAILVLVQYRVLRRMNRKNGESTIDKEQRVNDQTM